MKQKPASLHNISNVTKALSGMQHWPHKLRYCETKESMRCFTGVIKSNTSLITALPLFSSVQWSKFLSWDKLTKSNEGLSYKAVSEALSKA